ncbi:hypothetical protein VTK73DRAFT_1753 [Phialemonium thermophilum]|uniref:Uncharacterized protein n=1 Tax=Phialemonium thermophilum TaxID=223376 RepID=A0ABR3X8L1_9PEZI
MAEIVYSEAQAAQNLKDKVVVLTGGAQGIGAATVALFHELGAHVFFGDWDEEKGRRVEHEIASTTSDRGRGSVSFQRVDVRDYSSQLALFDAAFAAHKRVDVAVSCAAVGEPGGWFEPDDLDLETVRKEPIPIKNTIDINLTSVLLFSRIALAFMKASPATTDSFTRSLVLVSSIAGITEAPGLFAYSSAKHGVIGLMRALRPWAPARYGGTRANAICPWATDTQLLAGVRERWVAERLPLNQPGDVARCIVQCAADSNLNGKAVFVAGGRGFDTEEGVASTMPQWMGRENTVEFLRGQDVLGLGTGWTK